MEENKKEFIAYDNYTDNHYTQTLHEMSREKTYTSIEESEEKEEI